MQYLSLVRQRVENLNVRATVDGQLGMLVPEIGQSISRGANMGQINVLTSYKVTAQIDEHYIDRVRTQLTAKLDRQGSEFDLVVRRVYPEVRNGTFEIDMVFDNEMPDNIRTGQTYYISLQLGQPKVSVMVPIGGFFQETGGQCGADLPGSCRGHSRGGLAEGGHPDVSPRPVQQRYPGGAFAHLCAVCRGCRPGPVVYHQRVHGSSLL